MLEYHLGVVRARFKKSGYKNAIFMVRDVTRPIFIVLY